MDLQLTDKLALVSGSRGHRFESRPRRSEALRVIVNGRTEPRVRGEALQKIRHAASGREDPNRSLVIFHEAGAMELHEAFSA